MTFSSDDYELLKTGMLSDCQIKCEGKTWNLHKSILCARSKYFMRCLTGDWPEAKTGIVEITCFTEKQMDLLFNYIYTGDKQTSFAPLLLLLISPCMPLMILGDYFLVRVLCSEVESELTAYTLSRTQRAAIFTGMHQPSPQDWVNAGRLLYTDYQDVDNTHILKATFLEITLGKPWARKLHLQMPEFKTLCQEQPDFGSDCMIKLVDDGVQ
ncbi:hypothetical protein CPAR01_06840 [Colletotrichum paranaense]|uniref:BTB domain-containing protein n=1 Tax=Colletotrichum paranaense TaxID=1914294 RepID=A0ABQ9SMV9_9PEZI|nr:uncharacterized protein CPAR01_06840 [Colletotrichum paranaense]KAK1540851.1 hypothetical protein CPAR01_06840 [Colletotrichum paranaense]